MCVCRWFAGWIQGQQVLQSSGGLEHKGDHGCEWEWEGVFDTQTDRQTDRQNQHKKISSVPRNTAHIRKMSKKAKSEKRRETVTFPSLFGCRHLSTVFDICRIQIQNFFGCPDGCPVGCLVGCEVGWRVGCPVGWIIGCLVGQAVLMIWGIEMLNATQDGTRNQKRWKSEKWFYRFMDQKAEFGHFSVAFWSTFFVYVRGTFSIMEKLDNLLRKRGSENLWKISDFNYIFCFLRFFPVRGLVKEESSI